MRHPACQCTVGHTYKTANARFSDFRKLTFAIPRSFRTVDSWNVKWFTIALYSSLVWFTCMIHLYDSLVWFTCDSYLASLKEILLSLSLSFIIIKPHNITHNLQSFIMSCDLQFFDDIDDNTSWVVCANDELAPACFSLENQAALQLPSQDVTIAQSTKCNSTEPRCISEQFE